MITTNPVRVSSSMVTASSVAYPDTGESVWSSAVNYAAGATVSYSINGTFHRFESKQAGNLNHIPSAYPDDASNAWWIDLGYVNKLAAFQLERNTQTVTTSPYTVSVDPGERVGCIGIGNIEADSVRLRVYNSSAVLLYDQTNTLLSRSVYDWYSWTYAPFQQLKNTLFNNLPLNSGNTFDLTFTKSSGSVKVGAIVPGMPLDIGRALMGNTGVRMINFSLFERDEFGAKVTEAHEYVRWDALYEKREITEVVTETRKVQSQIVAVNGAPLFVDEPYDVERKRTIKVKVRDAYDGLAFQAPAPFPADARCYTVEAPKPSEAYEPGRQHIARTARPEEWTPVALVGQVRVRIGDGVTVGAFLSPGANGCAVARPGAGTGRPVEVMEITTPYDAARGYGVALCLVG